MPYILVEMKNPVGSKELLAAPSSWIQKRATGTAYVCWPYARSIRKLSALFEDEYSIPLEVWEKYDCEILCGNIPSLSLADEMIETLENQYEQNEPTISTQDNDPLGDVKPCPQMLNLMYELKSLIESNQQELREKLKEGFGKVEHSVQSMKRKCRESNAIQYEMGRADARAYQGDPPDPPNQFKVDSMKQMEELEQFEKQLEDDEYRSKVCQWIDASIGQIRDSEHRMHTLLDLLIDRKFFTGFSWTGGGRDKRPMNVYKNLLNLFEYAGTNSVYRADHVSVEKFMRKKLHNSSTRVKAK
uniref:DUF4806 domain-containing protein n=1 Tax=Anopheles epiroticus TaxID=199890 RepID=A0A182P5B1_9DIPT